VSKVSQVRVERQVLIRRRELEIYQESMQGHVTDREVVFIKNYRKVLVDRYKHIIDFVNRM
jgi:hypothetical protein